MGVDGKGPETTRRGVIGVVSPLTGGALAFANGDFGGPGGLPFGTVVKYPSSAAPARGAGSFTTSPAFLSLSKPLLLLVFALRARLFALGTRSTRPYGTLRTLPSLPPIPSFTLPFGSPIGVCGHPPGIPSSAGVGRSQDSFRCTSLD